MHSRHNSPETLSFTERYYARNRSVFARNLGRLVLKGSGDYENRLKDEFMTSVGEALEGKVATEYSFNINKDSCVVASDGELLEFMMVRGLDEVIQKAEADPFYADFLPHRARYELEELQYIQKRILAGARNEAIIVLSPYSEEYAHDIAKLESAYQRPDCRRAMLRATYWEGGRVHVITRSLDNASVRLLQATAKSALGFEYSARTSTEMLGERISCQAPSLESIRYLVDVIVEQYDELCSYELGYEVVQGRARDAINPQTIIEAYPEIAANYLKEVQALARSSKIDEFHKKLREVQYNHIALSKEIIEGKDIEGSIGEASVKAGSVAAYRGDAFNACGVIISMDKENEIIKGAGFESLMHLSGKRIQCPECLVKVVVNDKLLEKGILQCSECDLTVSVCGDNFEAQKHKRKLKNAKQQRSRKRNSQPNSKKSGEPRTIFGFLLRRLFL